MAKALIVRSRLMVAIRPVSRCGHRPSDNGVDSDNVFGSLTLCRRRIESIGRCNLLPGSIAFICQTSFDPSPIERICRGVISSGFCGTSPAGASRRLSFSSSTSSTLGPTKRRQEHDGELSLDTTAAVSDGNKRRRSRSENSCESGG